MHLAQDDDKPIPTEAASKFLNEIGYPCAADTLSTKRTRGGGPTYIKAGSRVLYKPSALRAWAASNTRELSNTSEAIAA
jgi:hypothetical protein